MAAAARVPQVVFVVGPVGGRRPGYRAWPEAAARRSHAGAEVDQALLAERDLAGRPRRAQGASLVVYMGHGNGWPSRYRDALYPPTQNGFGLNPVAGGDDSTHQYFGEASVDKVKLAKNAVVLLNHLCYASGNSEPGLPEGTHRWRSSGSTTTPPASSAPGAAAVVAEAHMGPAYYVRSAAPQPGLDRADLARLAEQQRQHDDAREPALARASPSGSTRTARAAASTARSCRRGVSSNQVRSGATGTIVGHHRRHPSARR